MSDFGYSVELELSARGDLSGKIGDIARASHEADSALQSIGSYASSAMGAMGGLLERVSDVAMTFAKIGVTAGIAGVVHDTVTLNKELENTQISLAAVFGAQGITANMTEGMGAAKDLMKDIRKDAAALPGETKDLMQIFRMAATPGFQSGMSAHQIEKLSANTMAASAALNMPFEQAARELGMMLQGRVGSHNILATQMGIGLGEGGAKAFHEKSPEERVKEITAAFEKFQPAIEVMGNSFDGVFSTFKDSIKRLRGEVTAPLFDVWKQDLAAANDWLEKHHDTVERIVSTVGGKLVTAWETIKSLVSEAAHGLHEMFASVEGGGAGLGRLLGGLVGGAFLGPAGGLVGSAIGGSVGGGSMAGFDKIFDQLGQVASALMPAILALSDAFGQLWAAAGTQLINVIVAVAPILGELAASIGHLVEAALPILPPLAQLAEILIGALAGAIEAVMPALEAIARVFAEVFTAVAPILQVLGQAFGQIVEALTPAFVALAQAFASILKALEPVVKQLADAFAKVMDALAPVIRELAETFAQTMEKLAPLIADVAEIMAQTLVPALESLIPVIKAIGTALHFLADPVGTLAGDDAKVVGRIGGFASKQFADVNAEADARWRNVGSDFGNDWGRGSHPATASEIGSVLDRAKSKTGAGGGGGGTNVQKVEIVVTSNQDANRVARLTVAQIMDLNRHPKISRGAKNWSAANPT